MFDSGIWFFDFAPARGTDDDPAADPSRNWEPQAPDAEDVPTDLWDDVEVPALGSAHDGPF